ncbi:hypothetical protein [Nitrosococcus watsonii]|uniref:PhnA-like protein n=1 Tax=Nitrosococcus watsoni (strain C-113) TaxID=105559 RepID=D8K885_NITWC|nr:hypothetical protein [Nitrosococcus watsonii]ADJ27080.1 conserved hypothetical protein [Nitrosococcus watsonii C-113]
MVTAVEQAPIVERKWEPLISWGAVFAGLFFVIATAWLLFLLGSAIGVGIADATDLDAMGEGLGIGATIWIIVSMIVAFFLGALLTARLAGKPDKTIGILHGITVWSVSIALMLVLGAWGVSGIIHAGQALVEGTMTSAAEMSSAGLKGTNAVDSGGKNLVPSPVMNAVEAQIKRRAAKVIAENSEGQVSSDEARQTLQELDGDTLASVAQELILGNEQRAKNVLVANTNLSEQEINGIIDGVSQEIETQIKEIQAEIKQRAETVADYTEAVLWVTFVSAALGLIAAIFGGLLGASTVRRIGFPYYHHPSA